jgi:hypothetical protein
LVERIGQDGVQEIIAVTPPFGNCAPMVLRNSTKRIVVVGYLIFLPNNYAS